jgi:acyl-CoA thioester hydrolase
VEGFPFVHHEVVRFRDLDAMGHVNNAVYSTYLEQARIAYFHALNSDGPLALADLILARTEIDFRAPGAYGEHIEIGVRPARVGTKSFDLEYEIRAADRVLAEAKSVLVGYDYEQGCSIPIPQRWKERLAA